MHSLASKVETSLDKTHRIGFVCHVLSHQSKGNKRKNSCGFIIFSQPSWTYINKIYIYYNFLIWGIDRDGISWHWGLMFCEWRYCCCEIRSKISAQVHAYRITKGKKNAPPSTRKSIGMKLFQLNWVSCLNLIYTILLVVHNYLILFEQDYLDGMIHVI